MPGEDKKFTPTESAIITESVKRSEQLINEKLKSVNWLMAGVVVVLFIAVITMFLMVAGLLLDAWHFNSAVYKEYSNKIDVFDSLRKNNEVLKTKNPPRGQILWWHLATVWTNIDRERASPSKYQTHYYITDQKSQNLLSTVL